ncbi:hypothetical protein BDP81DRAFT_158131 [Colletotrichum phormii]|uniref:Uncharacterized protein n=1 Tax=Colletotrichum phormii TaxID=359342 RepID=A0AAJ0A0W1_9PEZI|nr:uncharacterized protein BDP81DRAFT_158131 [Colletotrichum phormii]KAK1640082.1 hypothetical protein BDP81DRAFT_158131 [Colletotrichum phormii]
MDITLCKQGQACHNSQTDTVQEHSTAQGVAFSHGANIAAAYLEQLAVAVVRPAPICSDCLEISSPDGAHGDVFHAVPQRSPLHQTSTDVHVVPMPPFRLLSFTSSCKHKAGRRMFPRFERFPRYPSIPPCNPSHPSIHPPIHLQLHSTWTRTGQPRPLIAFDTLMDEVCRNHLTPHQDGTRQTRQTMRLASQPRPPVSEIPKSSLARYLPQPGTTPLGWEGGKLFSRPSRLWGLGGLSNGRLTDRPNRL